MSFNLKSVGAEADRLAHTIEDHPMAALSTAAGVGVGIAAVIATRGRALESVADGACKILPDLEVTCEGLSAESNAALREPTLAEQTTASVARMSFKTGKRVLKLLGKDWEKLSPSMATDDVRRTVINRFMSSIDQDRYILHGSYPLECRSFITRKAVADLDLIGTDASLLKPTRAQTDEAVLQDLRQMLNKPNEDGITFEVPGLDQLPPHVKLMQPKLRVGYVIARQHGAELMKIPLDLRVGSGTILEPVDVALKGATGAAGEGTVVKTLQPEETFASKLFSYSNRTFGFTRKPKDLNDMAAMVRTGLNDDKVAEALQAYTTRGYSLGPMRHPAEMLGRYLPSNLAGQTPEQLDENFATVRNYYAQIAPRVQAEPLRDGVSTSKLAQLGRFLHKQYIVYPAG